MPSLRRFPRILIFLPNVFRIPWYAVPTTGKTGKDASYIAYTALWCDSHNRHISSSRARFLTYLVFCEFVITLIFQNDMPTIFKDRGIIVDPLHRNGL